MNIFAEARDTEKMEDEDETTKTNRRNKTMSKLKIAVVGLVAAIAVGAGIVGRADALSEASLHLRVTVAPALSMTLNKGDYDFGNMPVNTTSISTSAIVMSNNSAGRTEDFRVSAATTTSWTISETAVGVDTYMMRVMIQSTAPLAGDFEARASTLGTNNVNLTVNNSSHTSLSGNNVASGGVRNLWFYIKTPTETAISGEQTLSVTVTALDSSTF